MHTKRDMIHANIENDDEEENFDEDRKDNDSPSQIGVMKFSMMNKPPRRIWPRSA
jgi:hypothetical protein